MNAAIGISENILRSKKLRLTRVRVEILDLFRKNDTAISFPEIKRELNSMCDDATLFRNLKKFLDSDIIHQIPNNEKTAYYALNRELVFNGGGGKNHVHFYCFICGQTFCLDNCGIEEMRIPAGYKLDSINILIRGICEKCG